MHITAKYRLASNEIGKIVILSGFIQFCEQKFEKKLALFCPQSH